MKIQYKFLILLLSSISLWSILGFVIWNWNLKTWGIAYRMLYVGFFLVIMAFLFMPSNILDDEKKK